MVKSSQDWVFGRGVIVNENRVYILSFPIVNGEGGPGGVTQVINWSSSRITSFMIPWEAKAITYAPKPEPFISIMGPQGDIFISSPRGNTSELIDDSDVGPNARGMLRDMQFVGDHLFATGMGRQIYKRMWGADAIQNGYWIHVDKNVLPKTPSPEIIGYCSIGGYDEDEIYVVGWSGEIRWYNGRKWNKVDTPTNLKLERVICAPNGKVFALGQSAIMIKGRKDKWELIDHSVFSEQIWGATWFSGEIWLNTELGIFRIDDREEIIPVKINIDGPLSFRWLDSAENVLWSFGPNHLLRTKDGIHWDQITFI